MEIEIPTPKKRKKGGFEKFVKKFGTPLAVLVGFGFIAGSIYLSFRVPNQKLASSPSLNPSPQVGEGKVGGTRGEGEVSGSIAVSADDDPYLGPSDAKVTIIEFSDYQCPFCRQFWRETLPQLKKDYIETGKVKFIYRDFPLSNIHPAAQKAAEGAECAREQDKYWEMHDKIFSEQDKKGLGTVQFEIEAIKSWAKDIGLQLSEFESCLDSGKYKEETGKDSQDGVAAGVGGTPTFFVNGRAVRGAVPYETIKQIIDQQIQQ